MGLNGIMAGALLAPASTAFGTAWAKTPTAATPIDGGDASIKPVPGSEAVRDVVR